jgi:hypothetical protein
VADKSSTPNFLVEQARMLVQTEEARFAASQSRATALLAVAGVIAGIGGGILTGIDGRDFHSIELGGAEVPIVLAAVLVVGAISIVALLSSAAIAIGALRKTPEPESKAKELTQILKTQFPSWLDKTAPESAGFLLSLLTGQRERVRTANKQVNMALTQASRRLGIAVASGLILSVIVLFGTSAKDQRVQLVRDGKKAQCPAEFHARLQGQCLILFPQSSSLSTGGP